MSWGEREASALKGLSSKGRTTINFEIHLDIRIFDLDEAAKSDKLRNTLKSFVKSLFTIPIQHFPHVKYFDILTRMLSA